MKHNPPAFGNDTVAGEPGADRIRPEGGFSIEEAWHESEDKYKQIFDNVNAVVVRLDKYGRIIESNCKPGDCFGFKREEVVGLHFSKLGIFSMKDLPRLVKLYAQAMRGNVTTYSDEIGAKNKEGQKITVKLYSSIIKKGGKIDGAIAIVHDITEQKRAEDVKRESEEKYKTIFENINDVIVRMDKYGRITEINSKVEEVFGFKREEVIGKHFSKLGILTVKDLPRMAKLFSDAIKGKVANYRGVLETRDKAGSRIFVDVNSGVVKKDGKIEGTVSLISNITEHREAEAARRLSEEKFSKVFSTSLNPICIVTLEGGKFIDVNDSYIRFTGYSRDEILNRTAAELNIWVNKEDPARILKTLIEKGNLYNVEINSRMKSGEIRTGLVSAEIINISDKSCMILSITDITERKRADEALRLSEEKFSKVFNSSLNPICIVTVDDLKFVDINQSFTQFTGYTREEAIGHSSVELGLWVNEDDLATITRLLIEKGRIFNYECRSRTKTGEIRTGLFSAEVMDIGGKKCVIFVITDITEKKWAEEALRESEEFTSSLLNKTPNPIFVTYPDTSIKYVNPAFEQLTGFSITDVIGMKMPYPWWPEKTRQKIAANLAQTDFGVGMKTEMAYHKKNDEPFWVEVTATSINKTSEIRYLLVNWVDITARKQMELALRESEEKFSRAFNASPSVMSITTPDGRYLEVNDSFTRISGYTRDEALGRSSSDLNIWADLDERSRFIQQIKEQGHIYNEEYHFRNKSGERHTFLFSAEQINISGEPRLISVSNDITARKRAEKSMQESEEKFSKAFNAASDAMAIFASQGGKFLEVNESYIALSGYSREELIGHNADELDMWGDPADREKILKATMEKGRVTHEEFSFRTKSGEMRTCLFSAEQINVSGERRMITIIQDITERKQAEQALRESEEKFSKVFRASANAICINSIEDNRFIEANESFTRFTGYPLEEVIGHNSDALNLWVNSVERQAGLEMIKNEGRVYNQEFHSRMKSGELRVGLSSIEMINIGGRPCRIVMITDITERKKAEEALRDSEEKFSKAFNASANAIAIRSLKNKHYIEVNDAFTRFTGYTREEVLGHVAEEMNLWVSEEEKKRWLDTIAKNGNVFNQEFQSRMKSGEIRVGLGSSDIINIRGETCRMTVITDITELKKAEEALLESEEKFSKAFLASPGAIAISTVEDGRFVEINESFVKMMGYTREEAIGRTSIDLNIWPEGEDRAKLISILKDRGSIHDELFRFRKKSGEIGLGLFSAEPIVIGSRPCMITVNVDVTEQKKAEESLRTLGSVTQQVTDSIIVTDPDFRITYMNKAAQQLLGYTAAEAMGTHLGIFDAVSIARKVQEDIRKALNAGKTWSAVLTKRRKDGSTFLCDCRRSPLFDESGRLSSYIVVYRDITEQKEFEARLKAQKQLIESILASMPEGVLVTDASDTVVLANESFRRIFRTGRKIIENKLLNETIRVEQLNNLYKAMKKGTGENNTLEFRYKVKGQNKIILCVIIKMDGGRMLLSFTDVSREREEEDKLYLMDRLASLGEMAAGLAHELNNPLTGILTLSHLLVNSDIPAQHKEDLECVYSEAKRAANIVKNVLLFTRNNSYENGQSSVNEVLKEVLRLREHEEKTNNISVVANLQDNLPEIALDKYQLQQVFLNIILNAEAAMKETGRPGTLTVTTEKSNHHINIMIGDTGCGITKDVLPRIFDPFFTTKEIGKGTGLGLSICYGIIIKHDGKISVKTQVGKGTTFTIRMPAIS